MSNCNVCCEEYNKKKRKRITCFGCDYDQCQECVKKYLLGITQIESKCMNCNVEWKRNFLKKNLTKNYLEGEYKEQQKKKMFDEERQHFPELMGEIEGYKRRKELIKEQYENRDMWGEMRKRKELVMAYRQIYSREIQGQMICPNCIQRECGQKVAEKVYRHVTGQNKKEEEIIYCRRCDRYICQHCLSMKEEEGEHKCIESEQEKVKELDKELEENERRKKRLQEENKELQDRILEIERGGQDTGYNQEGNQQKVQRNYYIHCPQIECNGYIDNKKDRCGVCETQICRRCNEEKTKDHWCKEENIESAKKIRNQCRQCPGCKTQIYKIEGCDDMYCVICNISFNWRTGQETKQTHNPHYYEYLRQRNIQAGQIMNMEQLNQRFQEIQNQLNCNNLVEGATLDRNIRIYIGIEEEEYRRVMEIHEEIVHIQRVKTVDIQCKIRYTQNKEDCMRYLIKQIGIDELMRKIQTNNKKREKLRSFQQILEAYVEVCKGELNQISEETSRERIVEKLEIMRSFKEYIKEQIEETKRDYDSKMKIL